MKNEDVTMFKSIQDKLGIKAFRYVSCPHATIKLHFSVCKCGLLCAYIFILSPCSSPCIILPLRYFGHSLSNKEQNK